MISIDEIMTTELATLAPGDSLAAAARLMHEGGFRHLPVVNPGGAPVGTISVKRAVHFLAQHAPEAVLNLPPEPGGYPETQEGG